MVEYIKHIVLNDIELHFKINGAGLYWFKSKDEYFLPHAEYINLFMKENTILKMIQNPYGYKGIEKTEDNKSSHFEMQDPQHNFLIGSFYFNNRDLREHGIIKLANYRETRIDDILNNI